MSNPYFRPSDTQLAMITASRTSADCPRYWLHAQWKLMEGIDFKVWNKMWERMVNHILLLRLKWDPTNDLFIDSEMEVLEVENFSAISEVDFHRMVECRCYDIYLNAFRESSSPIKLAYAAAFRWSEKGIMVWAMGCHHSLMDGNSFADCVGLHAKLYRAEVAGPDPKGQDPLAEVPSKRHLEWHHLLRDFNDEYSANYFRDIGIGRDTRGSISDVLRGRIDASKACLTHRLSFPIHHFDESPGGRSGVPLSAWIQASVALVLRRLLGSNSVVFAITRNLRKNQKLSLREGSLGLFSNTLPLTIDHDDQLSVLEHVCRVRERWLDLRSVEHCPYSIALKNQQRASKTLAVDWLVDINYFSRSDQLAQELNGICAGIPHFRQSTDFPCALSVTLKPIPEMVLISDANVVSSDVFQEIASLLKETFDQLIFTPNATLGHLNTRIDLKCGGRICSPSLLQDSLEPPNASADVVEQLESVVKTFPAHLAISEPTCNWTYQQVWLASGLLAEYILNQCPSAQQVVPIVGKRSAMTIITVWGVLRSGKAFILLSDEAPVLHRKNIYDQLAQQFGDELFELVVDQVRDKLELAPTTARHPKQMSVRFAEIKPDSLAYVVATSGTTGAAKLVMIEHSSLMYLVTGYQKTAKLTEKDTRLQAAAISSDTFVLEIALYMCHGCRIWVEPDLLQQGFEALNSRIEMIPITVIGLPSSVWKEWAVYCLKAPIQIAKQLENLRIVVCSMERTDSELLQQWRESSLGKKIWLNAYGPSETACVATILRLEPTDDTPTGNIPIGRCLPGAFLEIWNEEGHRMPRGVLGEIIIGGEGVGRGYFNNTKETNLRFVSCQTDANTTESAASTRVYKTGDLGYIQSDNQAVFVGRKDSQIKIRGHRVELEDIEFHIREAFTEILDAAVVPISRGNTSELVAFYTGPNEIPLRHWLTNLEQRLLTAAIPLQIHHVPTIPRSQVGKVERRQLIELHSNFIQTRSDGSTPANTESRPPFANYIIRLLRESLSLDLVDMEKGFIDLGGDSLIAMGILARIERETGIRLTPAVLLTNLRLVDVCTLWSEMASEVVHATPLSDGPGSAVYWMPDLSGDAAVIPSWIACWKGVRPIISIGISPKAFYNQEVSIERISTVISEFLIASCRGQRIHLLGLSFGGKVAWEVGQQLHRRGQKIGLVIVGDASARTHPEPNRFSRVIRIATHFPRWLVNEFTQYRGKLPSESVAKVFLRKARQLIEKVRATMNLSAVAPERSVGLHFDLSLRTDVQKNFMEKAWSASLAYRPSPAPLQLMVLRCRIRPLFGDYSVDLGWGEVAQGTVTIEHINIDHTSLFKETNANEICSRIEYTLKSFEYHEE